MSVYKRVLIKVSGESLSNASSALDFNALAETAAQIAKLVRAGTQAGVVVGGGNILRGGSVAKRMRAASSAHTMGMLATAINCVALEDAIAQTGVYAQTVSSIAIERVCENFSARKHLGVLESGGVLIFACGTGLPYFTTDTAAAVRAAEIGADALLLGKTCDAVYSDDPKKPEYQAPNPSRALTRFKSMSYDDYISRSLAALDMTCVTFCKERGLPVVVFGREEPGALFRAAAGENVGTVIGKDMPLVSDNV